MSKRIKENTPYKKGDILRVKIEDIGNDGEGNFILGPDVE